MLRMYHHTHIHTLHVVSAAGECKGEEDEEKAEGDFGCSVPQKDFHWVMVTDFKRLLLCESVFHLEVK